MTGSDGASGRRPRGGSPSRRLRRRVEGRPAGSGGCFVCDRSRRTVSCEQQLRIWEHLKREQPWRNRWRIPRSAAVCKDCCIAALDGHHCEWWDLCWRE